MTHVCSRNSAELIFRLSPKSDLSNNHYRIILLNKVPANTETHQTNDQTKIKDLFGIMVRCAGLGGPQGQLILNLPVADLNLKRLD